MSMIDDQYRIIDKYSRLPYNSGQATDINHHIYIRGKTKFLIVTALENKNRREDGNEMNLQAYGMICE